MNANQKRRALIVDDDREVRESLTSYLSSMGWEARCLGSAKSALEAIDAGDEQPDVVVSDVRMPEIDGLQFLEFLRRRLPGLPVLLITAYGDIPMAIAATRLGAVDVLEKPFDPDKVATILERAVATAELRLENNRLRERLEKSSGLERNLIGMSPEIERLRNEIADVADSDASVMIVGETGTGKELVADAVHNLSARNSMPFVAVNCAAIPENLFEAAMFGHREGAFTGATKPAAGHFVIADKGSLFLDELGACPLMQQPKLLRALEMRSVVPLGGSKQIQVDIRVISATNENLEEQLSEGNFREDLFYRLNTIILRIPPLRDRGDDVVLLFRHHLDRYAKVYGIDPPELSMADVAALVQHKWPGNVRELMHVAERRALRARSRSGSVNEAIGSALSDGGAAGLKEQVEAFERALLQQAMHDTGVSMDEIAGRLGIARRTLNEKLVKHRLNRK